MKYFSKRQIKQAKKVQEILFAFGLPTYKDLKRLIDNNRLRDSPISLKDIDIAEQICQKRKIYIKRKYY